MYLVRAMRRWVIWTRGIPMAKKAAASKARKTARPKVKHVSVPVPHGTSTKIHDLKSLSDKEVGDLLKKAKTSKVGFVILNAPFKVRPVEPVS
jgi:hypothetical protein